MNNRENRSQRASILYEPARDVLQILLEIIVWVAVVIYKTLESWYKIVWPPQPKSVENEIVLITGSAQGIGRELALIYASLGAIVVGWDVDTKANEATFEEIRKVYKKKAYNYRCDVSNEEQVNETAQRVLRDVGDVTILINNAGIMVTRPLLKLTSKEIVDMVNINLVGQFWTLRAFLPTFLKNGRGHIVALSSQAGILGIKNLVPYAGTKFAVRGLMEALIDEIPSSIKTTVIYPYMVRTALCKTPRIKYPKVFPLLEPRYVAECIVNAQRTNQRNVSVTVMNGIFLGLLKLLPCDAIKYSLNVLGCGVDDDSAFLKNNKI